MEAVREYLVSVTAAAIFCGVLTKLPWGKGTVAGLVKMAAGIFMALAVVAPWTQLRLDDFSNFTAGVESAAEEAAASGEISARNAMSQIIQTQTAAYILDKAESLGAELTVEVALDSGDIPAPCSVKITGNISPYAKAVLSEYIRDQLGIDRGEQTWIQS